MNCVKSLNPNRELSLGLPQAYLDIFVPQQNRPEGMAFFEEAVAAGSIGRVIEICEEKEKTACISVGSFCVYAPEEIVLAVDGIAYGLCSGTEVVPDEVEKYIPRNTCSLIKGIIGFKLADKCPYMQISDLIVGETTCDGKKKAYETLAEIAPNTVYVMELPQTKTEAALTLWHSEMKRFANEIEKISKKTITVEGLKKAYQLTNARRKALQRLLALRQAKPAPISGLDSLLVNQFATSLDPVKFTNAVNCLCDELEERVAKGFGVTDKDSLRVIVGGSPMAMPNWKVPSIIESSGAVIVGEESCTGTRAFNDLLDTSFSTVEEGLKRLTNRYNAIDCACFTPNTERLENVINLAQKQQADGVVHYALQFCTPFAMEGFKVKKAAELANIPVLKIETDYGSEDIGQLKTRVEAFLEML